MMKPEALQFVACCIQSKQQRFANTGPKNRDLKPLTSTWDRPMEQTNTFKGSSLDSTAYTQSEFNVIFIVTLP